MDKIELPPESEISLIAFNQTIQNADASDLRAIAYELFRQQIVTRHLFKKMGFERMDTLTAPQINQVAEIAENIAKRRVEERLTFIIDQQVESFDILQSQVGELAERLNNLQTASQVDLKEHETKGLAVSSVAAVVLCLLFAVTMKLLN